MNSLSELSDDDLVNAYYHAIQIGLSKSFIELLLTELHARQIKIVNNKPWKCT